MTELKEMSNEELIEEIIEIAELYHDDWLRASTSYTLGWPDRRINKYRAIRDASMKRLKIAKQELLRRLNSEN